MKTIAMGDLTLKAIRKICDNGCDNCPRDLVKECKKTGFFLCRLDNLDKEIEIEDGNMKLFLFNKRCKLAKMFEKWCKENNADDKVLTNMITWLYINNLLNVEAVEEFIKDGE